jgi:hypothetical protein
VNPVDRLLSFGGIGVIVLLSVIGHLMNFFFSNQPDLVVEPPGVRLGGASVPWSSIWQVVVISTPVGLGIRLRPGAPLPDGMSGVVYDPGDPQALHVRRDLPARDADRLAAAVRAFAPPGVNVVFEDVAPRSRPPTGQGRQDTPAVVTGVRMRDHSSHRSTHYRYRPHPVVSFALADGRQVIAESRKPGPGQPGAQVVVSYAADDPTDVLIHGKAPKSVIRWTSLG